MNAALELDTRSSGQPPLEAKTRVRASALGAAARTWASTDSTPAPCWGNSPSWAEIASVHLDGQNRRIGKKVNGVLMEGFIYRSQLKPVAWLDATGAVRATFVYGLHANVPEYMVQGGTTYRIITDQVGSVRLVENTSTGSALERIDYDEFGKVLNDTAPGAQPFGFAGGLRDLDTGLTRFGSRDYDPVTGTWTAKDPLRFGGGLTNLYSYVGGDPINHFDPNGRWVLVFGGMAEGQFAFWGLQGSIQFAVDGSGHFGLASSIEGRTGFDFSLGAGPAAGLYPGMGSIDALNGPTGGAGVDVGEVSGGLLFSSETELAQPNACRAYSTEPDRTTSARIGIGGSAFGLGGGFGMYFSAGYTWLWRWR